MGSQRARVLLLLGGETYRVDFVDAAEALGVEIVIGTDFRQAMATTMGDRAIRVDFDRVDASVEVIAAAHEVSPLAAVIGADERGVALAAAASTRLGLVTNSPEAVAATRDKAILRTRLAAAGVAQPHFALVARHGDPGAAVAAVGGFPVVVKPLHLAASQGVIRVDSPASLASTIDRVRAIACDPEGPVVVEQYVDGVEVAVEALLRDGRLEVLATFDKPDPLVGPYFEETIYVTPSRLDAVLLARVHALVVDGAAAIGLVDGPVHAEVRIGMDAPAAGGPQDSARRPIWLIEVAARSIGGLCARTLRFGLGVSLEQLLLRHAMGMAVPPIRRERAASGVMMLPIDRHAVLDHVGGQDDALAVPGIDGLEITIAPGTEVVPLPEGDRYLGFLFARAATPEVVEEALRTASAKLRIVWR